MLPGLDIAGRDCVALKIAGETHTVTKHKVAAIARLRRSFLGEVLTSETARIGDGINLDELAEGARPFQTLCDVATPDECDMSVQSATGLKRRHEWHPGELYPRIGFIVTNMSRPAERVVAFYNKRGTCEQWIKEGKGAIKWARLSCRTGAATASCACLQPRQLPADAGDARADQGLVADDLEGQADQDRREGGEPRPLCYLPDGRGRHRTASFCGSSRSYGRSHQR